MERIHLILLLLLPALFVFCTNGDSLTSDCCQVFHPFINKYKVCNETSGELQIKHFYQTLHNQYVENVIKRVRQTPQLNGSTPFCTQNGVHNSLCYKNCAILTSRLSDDEKVTCDGTREYCRQFPCVKGSICYCNMSSPDSSDELYNKTTKQWERCLGKTSLRLWCQFKPVRISKRELLVYSGDLYAFIKNRNLEIHSENSVNKQLIISKDDFAQLSTLNGTSLTILLPNNIFETTGTLVIQVYEGGVIVQTLRLPVIGIKYCVMSDCVLCTEAIDNFSCLHTLHKVIIVIMIITLFLLCATLIPAALYSLILFMRCLMYPIKFLYYLVRRFFKGRFAKKVKENVYKISDVKDYFLAKDLEEGQTLQVRDLSSNMSSDSRTSRQGSQMTFNGEPIGRNVSDSDLIKALFNNNRMNMFLIMLVLLMPVAHSCSAGLIVQSKIQNCVNETFAPSPVPTFPFCVNCGVLSPDTTCIDNGVLTICAQFQSTQSFAKPKREIQNDNCQSSFDVLMTLQQPGFGICFSIYSAIKADEVIATGVLTYLSSIERIYYVPSYYTWQQVVYTESSQRCDGTDNCPDNCLPVFPETNRSAYGEITTQQVLQHQGVSNCRRGCGCLTCGCFLCSGSCVFSRYSFGYEPNSEWEVSEVLKRTITPFVQLTITTEDNIEVLNQYFEIENKPFYDFNGINISVNVIGELEQSVTSWSQIKMFRKLNNNEIRLGLGSPKDGPIQGLPGEIQSSNLDKVHLGNKDDNSPYIAFANGLVTELDSGDKTDFQISVASVSKLSTYSSLPYLIDGKIFTKETDAQNVLISNSTIQGGATLVSLRLLNGYIHDNVVETVCPNGTFVESGGCYNCIAGSYAVLNLKSLCQQGNALIKSLSSQINLATNHVPLTVNDFKYKVYFQVYGRTTNDICLLVSGQSSNITICFNHIAEEPPSVIGTNFTSSNNSNARPIPSSFWRNLVSFWEDLFGGLGSWWEYIIFAIVLIITVILLVIALPVFIRLIKSVFQFFDNCNLSLTSCFTSFSS